MILMDLGLIINKKISINLKDFSLDSDTELEDFLNNERVYLGILFHPSRHLYYIL